MRKTAGIGLSLLGVAVAIAGIASCAHQLDENGGRREWPRVTGEVVASRVHGEKNPFGDNIEITVEFSYRVADRDFMQKQTWGIGEEGPFEWLTSDAASAERANAHGSRVTVYYNPDDPSDAVVEPAGTGGWEPLVLSLPGWGGAALAVFGMWLLLPRADRETEESESD